MIQDIYPGPGGLLDSKAHLTPVPVSQSMCRAPARPATGAFASASPRTALTSISKIRIGERPIPIKSGLCTVDFFELVFAYFNYYFLYSGNWDYYMSGAWTYESGHLGKLLAPGF